MADQFDVYHKWLSIPPSEQPPNHYRLLGLGLFESDPDVIQAAADRQMAHVQTYKNGPMSEQSQRLLNEISAAKLCLLRPNKKTVYDEHLRRQTAGGERSGGASVPANAASVAPPAIAAPPGPPVFPMPPAMPSREPDRATATISPSPPSRRAVAAAAVPPPVAEPASRRGPLGGKMALLAAVAGVAVLLAVVLLVVSMLRDKSAAGHDVGSNGNETVSNVEPVRHDERLGTSPKQPVAVNKTESGTTPAVKSGGHVDKPAETPKSNAPNPAVGAADNARPVPRQPERENPHVIAADPLRPPRDPADAAEQKPSPPTPRVIAEADSRLGKTADHSAAEWLDKGRAGEAGSGRLCSDPSGARAGGQCGGRCRSDRGGG